MWKINDLRKPLENKVSYSTVITQGPNAERLFKRLLLIYAKL